MSTCVHTWIIESALGDESFKGAQADPRATLRADLKRRQLTACDQPADGRVAHAESARGFGDRECKVGMHLGG